MPIIVILSGSPSHPSRSSAIASYLKTIIEKNGFGVNHIAVRDLPAADLALANFSSPKILEAQSLIKQAQGVIVVSPVYKASYPGILKSFLDLIPEKGLENKVVLPIATGGTFAHLLTLEFAFKPVFSILGSNEILNGVYIIDSQINYKDNVPAFIEPEAEQRLTASLDQLFLGIAVQHKNNFPKVNE